MAEQIKCSVCLGYGTEDYSKVAFKIDDQLFATFCHIGCFDTFMDIKTTQNSCPVCLRSLDSIETLGFLNTDRIIYCSPVCFYNRENK